ncbi:MAG: hypothetical protein QXL31_06700 [Thermosphaera sp.]
MGLTSPWIKYLLIFIVGGLAFMLIAPTLAMLAALLLMLLVIGLIFAFIIPGGWIFSSIASRSLFLLLSFRVLRKIMVVGIIATATSFMLMVLARSSPAFLALSFISGGALALLLFAPWPAFGWRGGAKAAAQPRKESIVVEVGRGGLSREGLTGHELESGVLIVGARARTVARKIIGELAERGRRVVIIGSGRLIPEGARAEYYRVYAVDASRDFEQYDDAADNMVYALALANRLKNDDVSMLLPAARIARLGVLQGTVGRGEILHSIQVQDRRLAPLLSSIAAMMRSIAPGGLHAAQVLSSPAPVVCVEPAGSARDVTFIMGYLILMLADKNVVLVVEDPEIIIKDVNLLSYESREPWERLYIALDCAKLSGLILVSRAAPKTERVWSLCNTYILTELSDVPYRVGDRVRALIPLIRSLKPMEAIISGEGDRRFKIEKVYPAAIEPKVLGVEAAQAVAHKGASAPAEASEASAEVRAPQLTALERAFGDRAVDVARLLEQARGGLSRVLEEDSALVKELEEKGYLASLGEVYYTTAMGEELLSEYQKAVRERGAIAARPAIEAEEAERPAAPAQAVIDADAGGRLDEALASFYMAESLFRQGKYGPCVMVAYEFMCSAIKKFFDIEKGHLDDLVKELSEVDVGITHDEAKDAKTLLIEVSNALKEGRQVSITSAQRMLKYARRVLEALSRAGGAGA